MFSVEYLDSAVADMSEIGRDLAIFSERGARNIIGSIKSGVNKLKDFPNMGTVFENSRRLVCGKYSVFYKVDEEKKIVKIIRVLHGRRDTSSERFRRSLFGD